MAVHRPLGTGPTLGSGPLGIGGVGESVGLSSGGSVGSGVGPKFGVQRSARVGLGVEVAVSAEPLGDADEVAGAEEEAGGLGEGVASALHAVAASAIRTTAARQNDPRLLPRPKSDPRST